MQSSEETLATIRIVRSASGLSTELAIRRLGFQLRQWRFRTGCKTIAMHLNAREQALRDHSCSLGNEFGRLAIRFYFLKRPIEQLKPMREVARFEPRYRDMLDHRISSELARIVKHRPPERLHSDEVSGPI